MNATQRQTLFDNTARAMGGAADHIQERHIANCTKADPEYGAGVAAALRRMRPPLIGASADRDVAPSPEYGWRWRTTAATDILRDSRSPSQIAFHLGVDEIPAERVSLAPPPLSLSWAVLNGRLGPRRDRKARKSHVSPRERSRKPAIAPKSRLEIAFALRISPLALHLIYGLDSSSGSGRWIELTVHVSSSRRSPSSATPRQLIKVVPPKGLGKKQIAPPCKARARVVLSGKAVMNMNGTP